MRTPAGLPVKGWQGLSLLLYIGTSYTLGIHKMLSPGMNTMRIARARSWKAPREMLVPQERKRKGPGAAVWGWGRGSPGPVQPDAQKVSEYWGFPSPQGPSPGLACLLQLVSFSCCSDFSCPLGCT